MDISEENSGKDEKIKELKEKLKAKKEECQQYKQEMINHSVVKRWQIGEYLHDHLAQQLSSVKILTNILKEKLLKQKSDLSAKCDEIIKIVDKSAQEVRNLSHDVIPVKVEEKGERQVFDDLRKQTEIQHDVNCILETDKVVQKINRDVIENLYNIAQEAIKNAVVHGEAANIKILLIEEDQQLHLQIIDDGKGFDSDSIKKGSGITIMKHRTTEMDGDFKIEDAEEAAFTICVTCSLPLENITGD